MVIAPTGPADAVDLPGFTAHIGAANRARFERLHRRALPPTISSVEGI